MSGRWKYFLPALVWGIIILLLCIAPGKSLPDMSFIELFQPDKVGHLGVYAIWIGLMIWGLHHYFMPSSIPVKFIVGALIFAICYGIFIEWVQFSFFPGRYFELYDIIANIIGCFIGLISLVMIKK